MKLLIIGGGISGLSAGIRALEKGYSVDIYEKNANAGGCCTGWKGSAPAFGDYERYRTAL